jgi:hypothetical protein
MPLTTLPTFELGLESLLTIYAKFRPRSREIGNGALLAMPGEIFLMFIACASKLALLSVLYL